MKFTTEQLLMILAAVTTQAEDGRFSDETTKGHRRDLDLRNLITAVEDELLKHGEKPIETTVSNGITYNIFRDPFTEENDWIYD